MSWSYKGVPLANPLVILIRLALYIPLHLAMALTVAIITLGWGWSAGKRTWNSVL